MIIKIDDYIGYFGILEKDISASLANLKSDDQLEVLINSPGGDVYEGIAIFNAIREVAKTHEVIVKINGLAASMATYIALAARTVNKDAVVQVSENSIFMIHNPWSIALGDYKAFEKQANYLKQLSSVLSSVYSAVSGTKLEDIVSKMDEETFYVGEEVLNSGFANKFEKLIEDGKEAEEFEGRDSLIVNARASLKACMEKQKENIESYNESIERAVALLNKNSNPKNAIQKNNIENKNQVLENTGGSMTVEELLQKDKDCYNAVFEKGRESAVEAEQKRVNAHLALAKKCGAYELAAGFINEGKTVSDEGVTEAYMEFAMNQKQVDARMQDNPPDVNTPKEGEGGVGSEEKATMDAFEKGYNS